MKKWQKDHTEMIAHVDSLETRPEHLTSYLTPNKHFFVCNHVNTPLIDPAAYRLRVGGDGVRRPISLSYSALQQLPSRTVIAYLECAGSQRRMFNEILGKEPKSADFAMTPWLLGGVGNAVWTGVSLRTVLEMADFDPRAVDVNAQGLDKLAPEGGVNRPIPLEKALDPDTMLVYFMNGEPIPPDHGFPVRLLVPGWIGSNSIKWVGSITVSTQKQWVSRNTEHYVYIGPEWSPDEHAPAQGGTITTQNIKSSLALPWKAQLQTGRQLLRGIARSPHAIITQVEWSADGGESWQLATLLPPILKYAWVRFEFAWDAPVGKHTIMTRATDAEGNVQPMQIPFNREGYLFNMVYPHPVIVGHE